MSTDIQTESESIVNTEWFQEIVEWNKERQLDQIPYDHRKNMAFIVEEIIETNGRLTSKEAKPLAREIVAGFVDEVHANDELLVDCLGDMIVFAVGSILRLGFDPNMVVREVLKVIQSRTGAIIEGKFEKDESPEAKANWYEADFCFLSSSG